MKTFLFQGDSITDANRSREWDSHLGIGYPLLFAGEYGYKYPYTFKFINKGVSGDRSVDVYARIKRDIINIKPDYMSLLIGVNDVWHELSDNPNGVNTVKFETIISMLIEEVKAALPDLKIFMLEPFVLKASATEEKWDYFSTEVKLRAEAVKNISERYNLIFVPLQEKFDKASENGEASFWLGDGVHPTTAGHALIKAELSKAFDKILAAE